LKFGVFVERCNEFNQIFMPLAAKMMSLLKEKSYKLSYAEDCRKFDGTKIIFGAHSNPNFWNQHVRSGDIFVNLEPLYVIEWANKNKLYCELLKRHRVIDYCQKNTPFCGEVAVLPIPPQFHFNANIKKQFSVLFVGNPTSHRKEKLGSLIQKGIPINFGFRIFGDHLEGTISRAKIFLSINDKNQDVVNKFRFSLCGNSSTLLMGEYDNIDENPDFKPLIGLTLFRDIDHLADGMKLVLRDNRSYEKALEKQQRLSLMHDKLFTQQFCSVIGLPTQ